MSEAVLIGGKNDGRRLILPTWMRSVDMPVPQPFFPTPQCELTETYVALRFRGAHQEFDVWVIDGADADFALGKLVEGYAP